MDADMTSAPPPQSQLPPSQDPEEQPLRRPSPLAPARIGHAGGGMQDLRIYNNSEESILFNLTRNFKWFELDFIWVDDELVTDAGRAAKTSSTTGSYYDAKDEKLASKDKLEDTTCLTLAALSRLMEAHPFMRIVTDVKDDNLKALQTMKASMPSFFADRIIAQIYQPEEYAAVWALGFNNIIWTLYKYDGTDDDVILELEKMSLVCVTMPQKRAESGFGVRCDSGGNKVMTHTINDPVVLRKLILESGVSEVYSDFINPGGSSNDLKALG
jgi:hypothetical protein